MNTACSQRKKEVAGISDMHELAQMVSDLNYQSLSEFLINLAGKIAKDAEKDELAGRAKLARALTICSINLYAAEESVLGAWRISKSFMETKK